MSRLEFNEDVHIALGTKILPEHGTKERELADMVAPAEVADASLRNIYPRA